jgi:serine/threonine protein kinase
MNTSTRSSDELARVHDLLDEFRRLTEQDGSVSPEEFAARYPEHQDLLLRLLPAAQVLSRLSSLPTGTNEIAASQFELEAKTLGDFRILREIARGGMGIVFEAEQISLERPVALKILPMAGMLDELRLKRFRNEARAAAMLKHPNIVSVHAVGCERGVHFYAMELVEGNSLADVIRNLGEERGVRIDERGASRKDVAGGRENESGPPLASESASLHRARSLSAPRSRLLAPTSDTPPLARLSTEYSQDRNSFFRSVARLGIQAARALHYAHQEGVIHRDIKPSNLLLDNDGELHITDFGLARIQEGEDLTLTGDVVGTLRYMSPEQVDSSATVDHRSDICSLGLTLYELVTGRPAFSSRHRQELISQVQDAVPVRPS